MKTVFLSARILPLLALLLFATSCKQGFRKEEGRVWYYEWTTLTGQIRTEVDSADYDTFRDLGHDYACDHRHAWYRLKRLAGADGSHFRSLGDAYAADQCNVFYEGRPIPGADPSTLSIFREGLARDAHDYYSDTIALQVVNIDQFRIVGRASDWRSSWGIDDRYVYFLDQRGCQPSRHQPLADAASFRPIVPKDSDPGSYNYATDRLCVYYCDTIVVGADPATFHLVGWDIAQDAHYVYARHYRLPDCVDVRSLKVLSGDLFSDSLHVFCRDSLLEGIDPARFVYWNYPDGEYIRSEEMDADTIDIAVSEPNDCL